MKNFQYKLIVFLFVALAFPFLGASQDNTSFEFKYEIKRVFPYVSVTKEKLIAAHSLIDLNHRYEASWVKEYVSVEFSAIHDGKVKTLIGKNDILSQEQKEFMNTADLDTDISVKVLYIPDNNLKDNDVKEISFSFSVDPEKEAKYPGGEEELKKYLKEKAIDKITCSNFSQYELSTIKFTINVSGEVTNVHIFDAVNQAYKQKDANKVLLEAIQNMPCWKAAEYADGTKAEQEFVLIVGDMRSCAINLVNINRDGKPGNAE